MHCFHYIVRTAYFNYVQCSAPNDLLILVRWENILTYLLTYLATAHHKSTTVTGRLTDLYILLDTSRSDRLWDGSNTSLVEPSQYHLCRSLWQSTSDWLEALIIQYRYLVIFCNPASAANTSLIHYIMRRPFVVQRTVKHLQNCPSEIRKTPRQPAWQIFDESWLKTNSFTTLIYIYINLNFPSRNAKVALLLAKMPTNHL